MINREILRFLPPRLCLKGTTGASRCCVATQQMALWEVVKYKEVGNVLRFYPRNRDSNTVNRHIDRILMGIY